LLNLVNCEPFCVLGPERKSRVVTFSKAPTPVFLVALLG
jgi:hypothetical protein